MPGVPEETLIPPVAARACLGMKMKAIPSPLTKIVNREEERWYEVTR